MKFRYSPEVDILTVEISVEPYDYGEDYEGVIFNHGKDGKPLGLEILDGRLFVMFANTSLVTGQEVTNPVVSEVPFTKERNVPIRAIPKGIADLRFKYHSDSDSLTIDFGEGGSEFCRSNSDVAIYYDRNGLPIRLEIDDGREFVLSAIESVLLQKEVTVA